MRNSVWQIDSAHLTPYYNLALCSALAQANWNVYYATSTSIYNSALSYPSNFETHFFYFPQKDTSRLLFHPIVWRVLRTLNYPFGHRKLLQSIANTPQTLVHLQWARLPFFDLCLIRHLHQIGIPVVYTAHDIDPLFNHAFDLSRIYTRVDAIIVHSEANRSKLLQRYPSLIGKTIRVIPHLAPNWAVPMDSNRAEARLRLGLAANVPVILFFGSNRSYKGFDVLLEAFSHARRILPDLWLLVAGKFENSLDVSSFTERQILIEPNYIPADCVWIYHLAADVAVLPYRQISQSGELITAMSFGLPVIVTDVGGIAETMKGNGWVVPPGDPVVLADAIVDAFSSDSRLHSLSILSREIVRDNHSPDLIAQQTIALYSELI